MVTCLDRAQLHQYLIQDDSLSPEQIERIVDHVETCPSCQELLDGLTDDEVSQGTTMPSLPGYRIYKYLGAGAFGEVWLAQDLNLPRVVAAKTLKVGVARNGLARALEALRQDANLMTQVEHPNVVRVYAWLTVHDHHYLVMQYVSGGSLSDLLKSEGPLDWQRAARYVADVGEGLLEVHARGIVHRDVKPANILWDPRKDEALLTDFGIASRLTDPANIAGSIPYMAPEALDGRVIFLPRRLQPGRDVLPPGDRLGAIPLVSYRYPEGGDRPGPSRSRPALRGSSRAAGTDHPRRPGRGPGTAAKPDGVRLQVAGIVESAHRRFLHDEPPTSPVHPLDRAYPRRPGSLLAVRRRYPSRRKPAPVDLRLIVSRQVGPHGFVARGRDPPATTAWPPDPRHEEGSTVSRPGPAPYRRPGSDRSRHRPARLLDCFQRRPDRHAESALPRSRCSEPRKADRRQSAAAHRRCRDDAAGRPRAPVRRLDAPASRTPPRSVAQPRRKQARGFSGLPALRRDPRHEARPAVGAAVAARGLARRGAGAGPWLLKVSRKRE